MIATATMQDRRRPSHATIRAMVADPGLDDSLAAATALSLDLSATCLKHIERGGRISKSRASRWTREGRGSPLYDVTTLIYHLTAAGQSAGAIVAHAFTTLHHALMPIEDATLVRRFWELMGSESEKEGVENRAQSTFAVTGDLDGLERATLAEAAEQQELAAVCRELRRRGIDPRTQG